MLPLYIHIYVCIYIYIYIYSYIQNIYTYKANTNMYVDICIISYYKFCFGVGLES